MGTHTGRPQSTPEPQAIGDLVLGGLVSFYAVQFTSVGGGVLALVYLGLIIDYRIRIANSTVMPAPPSFVPVVALLLLFVVVVVLRFVQG